MNKIEFSKTLKDLNLQMFKTVSKRHKELGIDLTPIQGTIILAISESQEALCQKHCLFSNKVLMEYRQVLSQYDNI